MAPERYHSNVLEPLTPPRTPCVRLRSSRPAPQSLTGTAVRAPAGSRAISAPIRSGFCSGYPGTRGSGAGGYGRRVSSGADSARKGPETRPLPAHCEVPRFLPPEVAAAALLLGPRPWRRLEGTEAPTRAPGVSRARASGRGHVAHNKLLDLFLVFCEVRIMPAS